MVMNGWGDDPFDEELDEEEAARRSDEEDAAEYFEGWQRAEEEGEGKPDAAAEWSPEQGRRPETGYADSEASAHEDKIPF